MSKFCWLASYPKSGNTWLRLALLSLHQGGRPIDFSAERIWCPNSAARGTFDQVLEIESSDLTHDESEALRPRLYEALAAEASEPMIRKVHDAFVHTVAGEPLFPPGATLGVIYIVRDPRDVAISFSHHIDCSIDRAIEIMDDPGSAAGKQLDELPSQLRQRLLTWSGHVESWLDSGLPVLLIRYEDMLADPPGTLTRVASLLGWSTEPSVIAAAVEATRFDRLRDQEQKKGFRERRSRSTPFFRRGIAGGWRDTLTPEQIQRIERDHGRVMTRTGYTLTTQ